MVLSSRGRELKDQLDAVVIENDELKDKLRALTVDYESTRRDCSEMVEALNAHKEELNDYRSREQAIKDLEANCQERADAALLQKKQAVARDVLNKKEIERLLEVISSSGKSTVAEIASSRASYRSSMKEKLATKEKEIHQLVAQCAQDKKLADKLQRDHASQIARLKSEKSQAMLQIDKVGDTVSALGERVQVAERSRVESEAAAEECKEEMKKLMDTLNEEKRKLHETIRRVEGELTSTSAELQSTKTHVRRLSEENSKLAEESATIRQDLATVRLNAEAHNERTSDLYKRRLQKLEGKVDELNHLLEVKEEEVANVKDSKERQAQHSSEELANSINYYERMIDEFKEESVRLRTRNDELSTQLFALQQKNQQLDISNQRKESSIRELQQAVKKSQSQTQNAKAQLSELLEDEEKRVKEMSNLRKRVGIAESRISRSDQNYNNRNAISIPRQLSHSPTRDILTRHQGY